MTAIADLFPDDLQNRILDRTRRFWNGEGRCMATVTSQVASYRQLDDEAAMLRLCADNLAAQAGLPGDNLPTFFPDFGTISTARHWGGIELRGEGGKPHLKPIASTVQQALEARRIFEVDDPRSDTSKALRLWRTLEDRHGGRLWLRSPDMQGTLTTAALLVEQSVLMESMMDEPALVHSLLSTICDHLLAYQRHLRGGSAGRLLGNIWPRANLPEDLGVSLTEDYMPLLSPRLYQEFGIPYLRRIADSFGGALIHCCGRWGRHAGTLAASGIAIRAVEFHHAYTTVDELKPLAERGVVLVPYMSSSQPGFPDAITYYRHLIASTPWRYLFALDDSPAEQAFARELADRDLTPA